MKKYIFLFLFIILLCGCSFNNNSNNTEIDIINNNIEYATEIYLYDFINITNGNIETDNYLIDTYKLGEHKITFKYNDSNKRTKKYEFSISVVDTTKPLILNQGIYTIKKGDNIDLSKKPLCGDNYDKNLKCFIIGNYDINIVGEYDLKFVAIDSSKNYTEEKFTLIVKDSVSNNSSYEITPYPINNFINKFKNNNTMIGIDVSSWQGNINWKEVKESNIEFVMIRIGFGHNNNNELVLDNRFYEYIKGAKEVGLKVGLYFYSYASNKIQALEQANWIIETLNGEKLDLPIAFDWEDWNNFNDYNISFVDLNDIAKTFMNKLESRGYKSMIYGSARYLYKIWNLPKYDTWLAHYTDKTDYPNDYYIWQISSSGRVNGIDGYVDLDILYKKGT